MTGRFRATLLRGACILCCSAAALAHAQTQTQPDDAAPAAGPEQWNAHFQSTYVWQRKPGMTSPYEGPNSLGGGRARSYSLTATAALGLRVARDTEIYFNPEMALGVPFSNLLGLGGFPNGELAKTSGTKPVFYTSRLFLRHTWGFGGGTEQLESDANQLAGSVDKRRLVFTAGHLSLLDVFDSNAYAHDPRTQFMNWALMTHAAYDYAADSRGYTTGFSLEWIDDGYAVRFGRYEQPRQPNGLALDGDLWRHFGDQLEFSKDYELGGRKGTWRLLAFRNRSVMASYAKALAIADASVPAAVPTLASARTGPRTKWGIGLAVEQEVQADLGVFGRVMHADGRTETYAFTEVDQSLSFGAVLKGDRWGRSKDNVGLALAVNGLSSAHRQFLAQGGTTFFLGDGQLRYGPERIFEAFYSFALNEQLTLSLDAQRIQNPGYNRDRGPATFVGVRVHAEF